MDTNTILRKGNELYDDIRSVIMEFVDYGLDGTRPIATPPTENRQAEISADYDSRAQLVAFLVAPNEKTWDALVDAINPLRSGGELRFTEGTDGSEGEERQS